MGPDWFTVIAQIINFLILVALLKRFLYGPVIRAMDRREAEIAARFDTAERKLTEAEQERLRYESLTRQFSEAVEEMRVKAREDAEALRRELLEKAREEVDRNRTQWRESLRSERESFLRLLRRHVAEEVCAAARKIVTDMADTAFEERMAACLERRIREMESGKREELAGYFRASSGDIVVRSAFELGTEAKEAIGRALGTLANAPSLHFQVAPSLVCGVEILARGKSLAWNVDDYLERLEERLGDVMEKESIHGMESLPEAGQYGR